MGKVIIAIKKDTVVIYNDGVKLIEPLSKYKDMSKEEILLQYNLERKGGDLENG